MPVRRLDYLNRLHGMLKQGINEQYEAEAAYETLLDDVDILKDKSRQLESMYQGSPAAWLQVFEAFKSSIPERVSISSMMTDKRTIRLHGSCIDDITAARLLSGLEKSGLHEDVRMERLTYKDDGVSFEIICTLKDF